MLQTPLTYLKLGLVGIIEVAIAIAMLTGKIDVTPAVALMTGAAGTLVLSLGLASAGQQTALAIQAHTRAMVSGLDASDQRRPVPTSGQRGFAPLGHLVALSLCAVLLVILAACGGALPAVPPGVANTGVCVIDTISKDVLAGQSLEVAVADAAAKCFGAASDSNKDQVRALWSSHLAAEAREHPDAGSRQ